MTLESVKGQMAEIAGYLWQNGWAERNGGNMSVNITDCAKAIYDGVEPISGPFEIGLEVPHLAGSYFIVTGTGRRMRYVASDLMSNVAIIRVSDDAKHYSIIAEQDVRPTSELPSHLAVHDFLQTDRPQYKAVVHTHPIELVAMSHNPKFLGKDVLSNILWSMIPETLAFCPKGLGIVPYAMPSSVELAQATLEQLKSYDVVMWEKHGVMGVGPDLVEAFDMIDTLSKSAKIYRDSCSMGFVPEGMSQAQMLELRKAFNL